jgi:hypothetical protein
MFIGREVFGLMFYCRALECRARIAPLRLQLLTEKL